MLYTDPRSSRISQYRSMLYDLCCPTTYQNHHIPMPVSIDHFSKKGVLVTVEPTESSFILFPSPKLGDGFFHFQMLPNALSFSDFLDFFAFPSHFIWLQNGTMKNVRFRLELNWSDTDGLVWPRHMLLDSIKRILVNRYHQDECIAESTIVSLTVSGGRK